ncbi:MAG: mitochondrial fission ELM1 family protein [Rickettsiales bacterium]|jgi:mitochondrial fission protein ELM1
MLNQSSIVWGITDGSAGMVAQVRALANAMDFQAEMKNIALAKPWSLLPNICYDGFLLKFILRYALREPENLGKPYPNIIISCGRKAALVAAALKNTQPQVRAIHIQDPQMSPKNFDVVVAMEHDKIQGDNVIKTRFALHSITTAALESAKENFMTRFGDYSQPHIAVLLGGSTNKYNLTKLRMESLISHLQDWLNGTKGSLLITPSRRTGEENIATLQQAFAGNKNVYIYDGKTDNPYMGLLACADEIIVTNDSVNMMSESFATGKPVTILRLSGHKNTKPANFAEMIKNHPPMIGDEMQKLAQQVKGMLS